MKLRAVIPADPELWELLLEHTPLLSKRTIGDAYHCRSTPPEVTIRAMPDPKQKISTDAAPAAIGPYSQAIKIGSTVYTSGQVALDPATGNLIEGGIREQTERALENLKAVLAAAGCAMANVVKTTVFLKDMNDFAAMNEIYARYLAPEGKVSPARSTVQVARLPKDGLVEIEVIAIAS